MLRLALLLALIPAVSGPWTIPLPAVPPPEARARPDTMDGIAEVIRVLRNRYGPERLGNAAFRVRLEGERGVLQDRDLLCEGGKGQLCHGGDPDLGSCRAGASCHPTPEFLIDVLLEEANRHPTSGLILGQAIYALVKFHQPNLAMLLVEKCEADAWLCEAMKGYVLNDMGNLLEAEAAFRSAMAEAPFPERCAYGDALWLLGEWDAELAGRRNLPESREETRDWPCLDRLEASDTLLWWADPLFSEAGNPRYVEHMSRAVGLRFSLEMRELYRGRPMLQEDREREWAERIRRGVWDSYRNPPGRSYPTTWTSEERARYHFVPNVSPENLSGPSWELRSGVWYEGYTPPGAPLVPVPVQTARFRAGDSLLVAVAGSLRESPLEEAAGITAHLILSTAPDSFPLHLTGTPYRGTARFLGQAANRRYLLGLEMQSSEGIGWHRRELGPLSSSGPGLSDLLLFASSGGEEPDSLLEAVALMLGSTRVAATQGIGVFWEVYGASPGTELALELALLKEDTGGFMNRVRGIFGGGDREAYGPVRWTEVATGDVDSGMLELNLTGLDDGEYELILRVGWEDREPIESRKALRVGEG